MRLRSEYTEQEETHHQKEMRVMSVTYKRGWWFGKVTWPGESHEKGFKEKRDALLFCQTARRQTLLQIYCTYLHCLKWGAD